MRHVHIIMVALALILGIMSADTSNVTEETNQSRNGIYKTNSTSGIISNVMPQGTSLQTDNNNTAATSKNVPTTSSASNHIATEIFPQGTSLQESNQTSITNDTTTSTVGRLGIDDNNIGNSNRNKD